jgi:hypothetical protein
MTAPDAEPGRAPATSTSWAGTAFQASLSAFLSGLAVLSDLIQVSGPLGWLRVATGGLAAFALLSAVRALWPPVPSGPAPATARQAPEKRPPPRRLRAGALLTAAVAAAAATVVLPPGPQATPPVTPPAAQPAPAATTGPTPAAPTTPTTPPPPDPVVAVPAGGCPDPDPSDPVLPDVEVCVVHWCQGPVLDRATGAEVPGQRQVKVRPRVLNNSTATLDLTLGGPQPAMRLLIRSTALPDGYSPPPRTAATGARPVIVTWNGQPYWAVPPNVPRDAYLAGDSGLYTGFATIWDGGRLGPGQAYHKPLRGRKQEGDLVFQVPIDGDGAVRIAGLAYVTRQGEVLGAQPATQWPPPRDPTTF